MQSKRIRLATTALLVLLIVGCGGGSGGGSDDGNNGGGTDTNTVPVANAGADQSVGDGDAVTLDGSGSSDSDGDALTYAWTQAGGSTVTLNNVTSATPSFTAPAVTADTVLIFELTVSDGNGGADSDTVDITVTAAASNRAPMMSGEPDAALVDQPFSFTPAASDTDGDTLTFSASNVPAWASFDAATGTLSGMPTVDDAGVHEDVTIIASDGELASQLVFDLVVAVDALEAAISSGDHRYVTDELTYITAIIETIDAGLVDGSLLPEAADVRGLFERFQTDSFSFDLTTCPETGCAARSAYYTEFLDIVETLKTMFDDFDAARTDIFKSSPPDDEFRYEKLLALIADHYRSKVNLPIYVGSRSAFLKSMYADHVVYTFREINPAHPDLGTFSRSDFSHITPENVNVSIMSRKDFRAAGVYALPGETVRVTRSDSATVATAIRVNTVRSGAVKEFDRIGLFDYGYNRPKYVTSTWIPIAAGESMYFTTPHGGPVQIQFDANDQSVAFTFENVGRHPYWNGPEDSAFFTAVLEADDYDWEEFSTEHFEVHTQSFAFSSSYMLNTPDDYNDAIVNFFVRYPYVLAGWAGEGIDAELEIHDWATDNGLEVKSIDFVLHANADVQVSCTGSTACAGNPYEVKGGFSPYSLTTHMHELSHNIEMTRRPVGWNAHTQTDLYYNYAVNRVRIEDPSSPAASLCYAVSSHQELFEMLQESMDQPNPLAYVQAQNLESDWRNGLITMLQMMALAENQGVLNDGWYLLSRLHVIDREYTLAIANDATWAAKAAGMGFTGMSRTDALALTNNDWWLITLSHILQMDMTDYLEMWGFDLSASAETHVAGLGLAVAPRLFYALSTTSHCDGLDAVALPVDGTTAWPSS